MKIAAETKEKENTLEGSERGSVLTLVPRSKHRSSGRAFRIGVADNIFDRRENRREKSLRQTREGVESGPDDHLADEYGESKIPGRIEPLFALAAAGFVIGFFLGRHSRD